MISYGYKRSPGYVQVIKWISEIWSDFDSTLLARSFDHCGITSRRLVDLHNQLKHFVNFNDFVDDVIPEEDTTLLSD